MRVCFTVNEYDQDGGLVERGIYLHFGDTRIRVGDLSELRQVAKTLSTMVAEIQENYKEPI